MNLDLGRFTFPTHRVLFRADQATLGEDDIEQIQVERPYQRQDPRVVKVGAIWNRCDDTFLDRLGR